MHTNLEFLNAIGPLLRHLATGETIFDKTPVPEQAKNLLWLFERIQFSRKRGDALHPKTFEVAQLAILQQSILMNGERRDGGSVYSADSGEGTVSSMLRMVAEVDRQLWQEWGEPKPDALDMKAMRDYMRSVAETVAYIGRCAGDMKSVNSPVSVAAQIKAATDKLQAEIKERLS